MMEITKQQQKDIDLLVDGARYSRQQATLSVMGPRKKVRAPKMAELEKFLAENPSI